MSKPRQVLKKHNGLVKQDSFGGLHTYVIIQTLIFFGNPCPGKHINDMHGVVNGNLILARILYLKMDTQKQIIMLTSN